MESCNVAFCVWFLPLNIFSRFIQVVTCVSTSILFIHESDRHRRARVFEFLRFGDLLVSSSSLAHSLFNLLWYYVLHRLWNTLDTYESKSEKANDILMLLQKNFNFAEARDPPGHILRILELGITIFCFLLNVTMLFFFVFSTPSVEQASSFQWAHPTCMHKQPPKLLQSSLPSGKGCCWAPVGSAPTPTSTPIPWLLHNCMWRKTVSIWAGWLWPPGHLRCSIIWGLLLHLALQVGSSLFQPCSHLRHCHCAFHPRWPSFILSRLEGQNHLPHSPVS